MTPKGIGVWEAVVDRHWNMVRLMIEKKPDIHSDCMVVVLEHAAACAQLEIVRLCIGHGTPQVIQRAVVNRQWETVKLLIGQGADITTLTGAVTLQSPAAFHKLS